MELVNKSEPPCPLVLQALALLQDGLELLDRIPEAATAAAHLDLAIHRLRAEISLPDI